MVVVDLKENTIPLQGICPRWSYHRIFKQGETYFYRYCRTSTQMNSEKSTQRQSLMVIITGVPAGCSSYLSFQSTASVGTWFIVIVPAGHGLLASFFFLICKEHCPQAQSHEQTNPQILFLWVCSCHSAGSISRPIQYLFRSNRERETSQYFEQGRFDIKNYLIWIG